MMSVVTPHVRIPAMKMALLLASSLCCTATTHAYPSLSYFFPRCTRNPPFVLSFSCNESGLQQRTRRNRPSARDAPVAAIRDRERAPPGNPRPVDNSILPRVNSPIGRWCGHQPQEGGREVVYSMLLKFGDSSSTITRKGLCTSVSHSIGRRCQFCRARERRTSAS